MHADAVAASLTLAMHLFSFIHPHEQPSRTTTAADGIDSVCTATAGGACATIATDEEAGGSTQRCPGIAGYALLVEDDDSRKLVPLALIVRVNANEGGVPETTTSYLAVVKIAPQAACVTDRIAPDSDMNLHVRIAASAAAEKPCLRELGL
jgi:hypothetical protein